MKTKFFVTMFCIVTLLSGCGNTKKATTTESSTVQTADETNLSDTGETTTDALTSSELDQPTDASYQNKLEGDLKSCQVQINDLVYSLPMNYAESKSKGWVFTEDDTEILESNKKSIGELFLNESLFCSIRADIFNYSENDEPISSCYLTSLEINPDHFEDGEPSVSILLPEGIVYMKSSLEDIKNTYGDPNTIDESDSSITNLYYQFDGDKYVTLGIDKKTNVLTAFCFINESIPEDM